MKILAAVEKWKSKGKFDLLGMTYGERLVLFSNYRVKKQKIAESRNGKKINGILGQHHDLRVIASTYRAKTKRQEFIKYWVGLYLFKDWGWRQLTDEELVDILKFENTIRPTSVTYY